MTPTRTVRVLLPLAFLVAGCEKDPPTPTSSPTQVASTPKPKPSPKASTKPPTSASVAPANLQPKELARGTGLGKLIALHNGYVYWTVRPGATCVGSADSCESANDGSIWRIAAEGGIPKEVVGSLRHVSSFAFSNSDVLWTMCGSVDYVQRCQVTSVPTKGGKRIVLFDAGPDLVQNVVWAQDRAIWAQPSKKELHQKPPKQSKPSPLSAAENVTDVVARNAEVFWTTGQPAGNDGSVHRIALESSGPSDAGPSKAGPSDAGPSDAGPNDAGPSKGGPAKGKPNEIAQKRQAPHHIAVDDTHVYWVEARETEEGKSEQVIMRVADDGGEPQIVVRGLSYVDDIALSDDKVVFVTDRSVSWAPKSGGEAHELTGKLNTPHGPAADADHAYWIADDKIWRVELP